MSYATFYKYNNLCVVDFRIIFPIQVAFSIYPSIYILLLIHSTLGHFKIFVSFYWFKFSLLSWSILWKQFQMVCNLLAIIFIFSPSLSGPLLFTPLAVYNILVAAVCSSSVDHRSLKFFVLLMGTFPMVWYYDGNGTHFIKIKSILEKVRFCVA